MLQKLIIVGYSDEKLTQKTGQYTVQINPETYSQQYATKFICDEAVNTGGVINKFVVQKPQDLGLEFYLDATGVLPGVLSVNDDLDRFKSIVYSYNGTIHSPNYLRILWGQLTFDCRLETLNVEYTLFTPSGVPLRAKLTTTFQQYLSPEKMQLQARNSSPDLTHSRITSSRDTLPLLCFQIYGDSKYYLDIARINGLDNFRDLQPGQKIVFPPLGD
ncbi:MAG TPA: hypothetical protein VGF01_13245 [Terracidiphilus sp.]|jgi:hypothetical protein